MGNESCSEYDENMGFADIEKSSDIAHAFKVVEDCNGTTYYSEDEFFYKDLDPESDDFDYNGPGTGVPNATFYNDDPPIICTQSTYKYGFSADKSTWGEHSFDRWEVRGGYGPTGNKTLTVQVLKDYRPWIGDLFDAMYMCLMSFSSVGYGDAAPATEWGKMMSPIMLQIGLHAFNEVKAVVPTATIEDEEDLWTKKRRKRRRHRRRQRRRNRRRRNSKLGAALFG